jgi:hypothetical protein
MSFKIAAALALLPSVQAGTGLCFGDNVLDTYAAASCALKYSTQAELDAAGTCPETCHSGNRPYFCVLLNKNLSTFTPDLRLPFRFEHVLCVFPQVRAA